ncbi:Isotrichodermin C-15 hydroxylase 6 [Paraphaeosphaeria sporulosa]
MHPWCTSTTLLRRIYSYLCKGDVFRVSPNELSFASVTSWKAIYGPWPSGKSTFVKSPFYDMYGAGFNTGCIGSERNPRKHAQMKRTLLPGFSARALAEQETIVQSCVDNFIAQLGKNPEEGMNMTEWFEMVAFDILGEMAFGESFHCVDKGEPHFWQQMISTHLWAITVADNMRRYALVRWLGEKLLPALTVGVQRKHTGYSRARVASRLASKTDRKDFLTNVIDKVHSNEVSEEELTAHASTFVIAGGETVATALAAITYHLCKAPAVLRTMQTTIRSSFTSYEAINSVSCLQIPYLQAVINEGLRIYPPGAQGFPRVSPGAEVDGKYIPAGTELYTSAWSVTHDPTNFNKPNDFIPERWMDPNSQDIKEASQPFSLGPRGCVGKNFAYIEMSLILAKMLFMYDIKLVNDSLDWEESSHIHVMWWKPTLKVQFSARAV